ncbi:hypothetical protein FRB99_003251 [Tulasnella sp. 403]|nr:hypothetical protein FRB99_003251 [Tulasnella sp. 403]
MPLDYQTDTGPQLTCRFSMGEYNGKPSFLLKSNLGLLWANLPPALEALVKMPNMDVSAKNFALGPKGMFWYTYQSVNNVIEQKGSDDLWPTLNEDWKDGCPIRLTFGPKGLWWGEKEWAVPGQGHLVQSFGKQPTSLVNESAKRYPGVKSHEIDYVAIGMNGCWVMNTKYGEPCHSGLAPQSLKAVKRETAAGNRIVNVVLSPCREDLYWIEFSDGTVDYFLPTDWDRQAIDKHIRAHVNSPEQGPFMPYELPVPSPGVSMLRKVTPAEGMYDFVVQQFNAGWLHPHKQPPPSVKIVYQIIMSTALHQSFNTYLADDYASSNASVSVYRSLLLARVVKGNAERRTTGDKKLSSPKSGFDCVEGVVGQELNYDETCVYHKDAIRPAFLILYR